MTTKSGDYLHRANKIIEEIKLLSAWESFTYIERGKAQNNPKC